ncbi:hypothetical protein Trydic_g1644 [Trypoxylus dichotomus]
MYKVFPVLVLLCTVLNIEGSGGNIYWRDYIPGNIPDDAFEAAPGLYIGQALYQGNLLVTTIYPYTDTAVGELMGQRNFKHNIKILCSSSLEKLCWASVNFSEPVRDQMKNAVRGGYEEGVASELYIGKDVLNKEWKIGKVIEITNSAKGLWVWSQDGTALRQYEFYILKYNSTS